MRSVNTSSTKREPYGGKLSWPTALPLAKSVVYLGTHLALGDCALPGIKHRLHEAKGREAKIHRAVRSRRLLSLTHTWNPRCVIMT